jgi:hypothetical protein
MCMHAYSCKSLLVTWIHDRMAPEMMAYLHGMPPPESPGSDLMAGLMAATSAMEAAAATVSKGASLSSSSTSSSPNSSSSPASPSPSTPVSSSSSSSPTPLTMSPPSTTSESSPILNDNGMTAADYGVPPPIEKLPLMPPAVRMYCSQNTAMQRLLGYSAHESAVQIQSMGWRLPFRLVWPKEAQQLAMANFRGVLGIKREFCLPLHILTKVPYTTCLPTVINQLIYPKCLCWWL